MKRETARLLLIVLALVFVGMIAMYSVSAVQPHGWGLFKRQAGCLTLGLALMFYLATRFDYHRFSNPVILYGLAAVSLVLLVLVLVPGVGVEVNGAQRWLRIGPFQFQPSELAKMALILLLAHKLTKSQDRIKSFLHGFLPVAIIAGAFAGLIYKERDFGVPVVIGCVFLLMVYVAGTRWQYIGTCAVLAVPLLIAVVEFSPAYRKLRFLAFLDPFKYRNEGGFHLIQSLAAFARGALWGVGPGAGEQKLFYLPAAHTDFIFAVWGEEMGLWGTCLVAALFCAFLVIGIRVARHAPDLFGALLAIGIVALISLHAAFNMGVTTGLLPTKGLTLPFISYGGTAQIVFLALTGVLLNIGLQARAPEQRRGYALAF
jgi:cell division protein FtsW